MFYLENGGSTLPNIGNYLPVDTFNNVSVRISLHTTLHHLISKDKSQITLIGAMKIVASVVEVFIPGHTVHQTLCSFIAVSIWT